MRWREVRRPGRRRRESADSLSSAPRVGAARSVAALPSLPLRLGALAIAAALLGALPAAAALAGWSAALESPWDVPGVSASADQISALALADGNLLFLYSAPGPTGEALVAVLTDSQGGLLQGPTTIAEPVAPVLEFSLAPRGGHGAAIAWVAGSTPALTLFDGSAFSSLPTDAFGPFRVNSCKVAAASDRLVFACEAVPLAPLPPVAQVQVAQVAPDGSLLAPLVALSTGPATESFLRALALDGQGTSWVAFQSPSAANVSRVDFALAAIDPAGALATPPAVLLPDTEPLDSTVLAPSPLGDAALWVSFAEAGTPSKNATVHLQSWRSGERTARAAASFEAGAPRILDAASFQGPGPSARVGAFAWLEDQGIASPPGPGRLASLRVVALDGNLSALDPVSAPLGAFSGGARFVGAGPAVVDGPSKPLLQRIAIAPPSSPLPAQDLARVVVALAGISGASTLALAALSDRFKWALLAALWPLYVIRDRVVVDNIRRGAILQVVTESPGIHFKALALRTGISQGALRHHLGVLEEFGFISRSFGRRSLTIYPTGQNPIRQEPFREIRAQILKEVRSAPGITHAELARRVDVKWSTLSYHMEEMRALKQVRLWRRRQVRRYYPANRP